MTTRSGRIVVAGGGLAGARACEQLRRRGHDGELILVSAEPHPPYDRPPLSKAVLLGERHSTTLPVDLAGLGVRLELGTEATGLDLAARVLRTRPPGGEPGPGLPFDGLVIATGAAPVRLPGPGEQLTVRTIGDARRLRARLVPGARVVIIGAGWIGAEVATAALARGCAVTCVEAGPGLLSQVLGSEVSKRLRPWWSGVDLRDGAVVDRVEDGAVVLADGGGLPADVVVAGVGVRPATGWLEGSGLGLDRGVVVDEWLRAGPGVVAAGDVAAWWSRRYGQRMRLGHWDDAATGAAVAASSVLADPEGTPDAPAHDPVPYFWSDQFGHKHQYLGHHHPVAVPIWREPADGDGWSAAWLDGEGRLAAVLTADRPRELMAARRAIGAGAAMDPARLADPSIPFTEV